MDKRQWASRGVLGFGFGRYRRRDARVVIPDFSAFLGCILSFVFFFFFPFSSPFPVLRQGVWCGVHFALFWLCLVDTWLDLCARLALDGVLLSSLTALCFATNSSPLIVPQSVHLPAL